MTRIEMQECGCGAVFEGTNHAACPYCKGSLEKYVELKGCALDGNREFRLDAVLVRTLNQMVGKDCIIRIKEARHEDNNNRKSSNTG